MPRKPQLETLTGIDDDALIRITDVAGVLGVSYSAAYELVTTGRIPFLRVTPRTVRVRAGALRAYLKTCDRPRRLK